MVALGGMHGCSQGACVIAPGGACVVALGGHVWLLLRGVCMVAPRGGSHMVAPGGHAWLLPGGVCVVALGGDAWLLPGGVHGCYQGGVHGIRRDTIHERAVRILLECILVLFCFDVFSFIIEFIFNKEKLCNFKIVNIFFCSLIFFKSFYDFCEFLVVSVTKLWREFRERGNIMITSCSG